MTGAAPVSALSLSGISAGYGPTIALRDVDLAVAPGTVAALLGPNGAGKTTLLRVVCGLLAARGGQVSLEGTAIDTWSAERRAGAGLCLIPEGRGIFRSLTVEENLKLFAADGASTASARVAEIFPALANRMRQIAGTMSGGEQQMLALSRAYLASPRVLLLDELSMGLAPIIVDQIFNSLRDLASRGITLVVVEQYVSRALEIADVVHVLKGGELTDLGAASDVSYADLAEMYLA